MTTPVNQPVLNNLLLQCRRLNAVAFVAVWCALVTAESLAAEATNLSLASLTNGPDQE